MDRTGIEHMSTAYKSAAVPLHQRCWKDLRSKRSISELSNLGFALQIFWVSHQKKPKQFFQKRSSFFANQTNFFSLIESCRFWFFTSQGFWEFKKRKEFTISRIICPSNALNSNVQSFSEIKNFFTGRMSLCIVWESNPCEQLGRRLCYHYTNDADRGLQSKRWISELSNMSFSLNFFWVSHQEKTKIILWKAE